MKSTLVFPVLLAFCILLLPGTGFAQKVAIGGRGGISIFGYGGGSSAGLQLGPTLDYEFQKNMLVGTEFNINTQDGTPIEWANYFKYLLTAPRPDIQPYFDGGFNLWFVTSGPYFGLRFGGGAYFKVGPNLYVPADVQFGPVFTSGSSTFYFVMSSGIRYILPQ